MPKQARASPSPVSLHFLKNASIGWRFMKSISARRNVTSNEMISIHATSDKRSDDYAMSQNTNSVALNGFKMAYITFSLSLGLAPDAETHLYCSMHCNNKRKLYKRPQLERGQYECVRFVFFSNEYATNKTLIHSSTCTRTDHLVVVIWARARITSQYADVFQHLYGARALLRSPQPFYCYCHYRATGLSKIVDRRAHNGMFKTKTRKICVAKVSHCQQQARNFHNLYAVNANENGE